MDSTFFEYCHALVSIVSLGFAVFLSYTLPKKSYFIWVTFGFLYTFLGASILYTVYPLAWLTPSLWQLLGITFVVFLISCVGALLYAPLGYILRRSYSPWKNLFLFSFSLMLIDVVRSFCFSLLLYGKGGSVGLHFDVTSLGHALSMTPLVEYAYFGGTYILTGILGLLVYTTLYYKKIHYSFLVPVFLVLGWIGIHYYMPTVSLEKPLRIAIISTDFPDEENKLQATKQREERFLSLEKMTYALASSSPDIIVYPEDARFLRYLSKEKLQLLKKTFPNTLFVDGDTRAYEQGFANYSLFYEIKDGASARNDQTIAGRGKTFLFPFSEYIPALFTPFLHFFMDEKSYSLYKENHSYTKVNSFGSFPFESVRVATLICSEFLSYTTVRNMARTGPHIVFLQSNFTVSKNRVWFTMQTRSFAQIAAATMRRPLIHVANGSESYIVSPYGIIVKTLEKGLKTTLITIAVDGSLQIEE